MSVTNGVPNWTSPLGGEVNCTAIAANGRTMLAGTSTWAGHGYYNIFIWPRPEEAPQTPHKIPWNDGKKSFQGVYWVDLSDDGKYGVVGGYTKLISDAAGDSPQQTEGLIQIISDEGRILTSITTPGGVEEVRMSSDGATVAWVAQYSYGAAHFDGTTGDWRHDICRTDEYCRSIAMSDAGDRLLVGCKGSVRFVTYSDSALTELGRFSTGPNEENPLTNEALEVACTSDFSHVAASLGDGRLLFWHAQSIDSESFIPTWTATTEEFDRPRSTTGYALTMRTTPDGTSVVIVWGTNHPHYDPLTSFGWVNLLEAPADGGKPILRWSHKLHRCPNPGLVLSTDLRHVGACDGQPFTTGGRRGEDTPGAFYYLRVHGSDHEREVWKHDTAKMNWGLSIANGGAMFGGSDTGEVFLWNPRD